MNFYKSNFKSNELIHHCRFHSSKYKSIQIFRGATYFALALDFHTTMLDVNCQKHARRTQNFGNILKHIFCQNNI